MQIGVLLFCFNAEFFNSLLIEFMSQKINFPSLGKFFKKTFKLFGFNISGIEIRFDCSLASTIIFFYTFIVYISNY